jgi:putative intracellular protease/amidase
MRPPHPDPDPDATGRERLTGKRPRWLRFAGHYLEMVVAMVAGMIVLGGALRAVLAVAGVEYSTAARYPELTILEMTMTMAVGMAAWMRFRGNGWAATLEMSGAMLTPAVAVLLLVWLDVLAGGAAMTLEHVAMFPLMLAVMLRRRDEYMTSHHTRRRSMRPVRFLARLTGALLAVLLLPVAVGVAGTRASLASLYQPREDTVAVGATPPAHDPAKATAILIGPQGANAADTLGPYEILATTSAFNLYTVAPERRPLPLTGGLDLVPDLTFAELDRRLGPTGAADVVIVPDMPKTEPVVTWLQQQRQQHEAHGTVLLSVCYGVKVLAKAGLLHGRDATTSWLGISWLARRYPAVTWHHGTRYVEDANGVLLTDGVGELELASAFSPYTEQSYAARTLALGTGQAVRTAHGLTFVPRQPARRRRPRRPPDRPRVRGRAPP